jgi:hypothetical protein
LNWIAAVVQSVAAAREELPAWFIVEIMPQASFWLDELDRNLDAGDNPLLAQKILPPFFDDLVSGTRRLVRIAWRNALRRFS